MVPGSSPGGAIAHISYVNDTKRLLALFLKSFSLIEKVPHTVRVVLISIKGVPKLARIVEKALQAGPLLPPGLLKARSRSPQG